MVITGVDWSGDAGLARPSALDRRFFVVAFASIESADRGRLESALVDLRASLRFRESDVFKHSDSSDRIRREFFEAIAHVGVEVRVRLVDKAREWPPSFARLDSNQRIASIIASSAGVLPDPVVRDGILLLDLDRKKDGKLCTSLIGAIHRSFRAEGREGFSKVKCCPDDDRINGEIIQVADMVAGAVRRAGQLEVTAYPEWNRILVPWQ